MRQHTRRPFLLPTIDEYKLTLYCKVICDIDDHDE